MSFRMSMTVSARKPAFSARARFLRGCLSVFLCGFYATPYFYLTILYKMCPCGIREVVLQALIGAQMVLQSPIIIP